MAVSDEMVERAAKIIFDDAVGLSKWDNDFYAEERAGCYISARKVLTAALSDQVVAPNTEQELKLARSQLAECHREIFKLREALVSASTPVRSS